LKPQDSSLLCNWEAIIADWDSILATSRKVIVRSLRRGIPRKYRALVWQLLTDANRAKRESSVTYQDFLSQPSADTRIIDCDVPRTFPTLSPQERAPFMSALRNVLLAYSNADREIGYVQGMNFLAGMFVVHENDEEAAFWCFYGLMFNRPKPYRRFFERDFPTLRKECEIVDRLLLERYPIITRALEHHGMTSIILTPQWFNSCFLGSDVDMETSTFVFDLFLAFGVPILLSFGMATVSFLAEDLQNGGFEEFMTMATNTGRLLRGRGRHEVNIAWTREWITNRRYAELWGARFPAEPLP